RSQGPLRSGDSQRRHEPAGEAAGPSRSAEVSVVTDDEFESPDRLLRRIYEEDFGFLPTNRSMKPVHVANATCRRLVGFTSDHIPLARVLRQYVKDQRAGYMEERNPNATILADFPGRFMDPYGNAPSDEHLTTFRSLAKETLGADGAAFETNQAS